MKIKDGYEIKKVSDRFIVIPTKGSNVNFSAIVTLNESGRLLFEALKEEKSLQELSNLLVSTYDVSNEEALSDVVAFINILKEHNLLS